MDLETKKTKLNWKCKRTLPPSMEVKTNWRETNKTHLYHTYRMNTILILENVVALRFFMTV